MSRKVVGIALFLPILVLSIWILAPFLWYPSIDDIDVAQVTREADNLFSLCVDKGYSENSLLTSIWVEPKEAPYLFSLSARGRSWDGLFFVCREVIHISMWRDWWIPEAGLYVSRTDSVLPDYLAPYAIKIADRVYRWSDDSGSIWTTHCQSNIGHLYDKRCAIF